MQDPISPHVLRKWAAAYLGGAPMDNHNQPRLSHAEWWDGIPVQEIFVSAGARGLCRGDSKVSREVEGQYSQLHAVNENRTISLTLTVECASRNGGDFCLQ